MKEKNFYLKAEDIKEILTDWHEADGCFVSDRITIDGCKVGYMYREYPDNSYDSGWRFLEGTETDEYINNSDNVGIYKLNTVCNYDSGIIPFLNAPYESAFLRNEEGVFEEIPFEPSEE